MFIDQLTEVLNKIPYKVWEAVLGCDHVDRVDVSKEHRFGCGGDGAPQAVVYIKSGIDTYVIDGLDSINQRNEMLLSAWKPYHDLIQHEIEEYNKVLQEPTNYLPVEYTEKENETRFNMMFESDKRDSQLMAYASWLKLKPFLKGKCYDKKQPISEKVFKETAFNTIFEMVKEALSGTNAEDILSKYGIDKSESPVRDLDEITEYCRKIIPEKWNDENLQSVLHRFLSQRRSIIDLKKEAESILEDSLKGLNEKEREYCHLLQLDEWLRSDVLSLDKKLLDGWTYSGNLYARGRMQGRLYGMLEAMYEVYALENQAGEDALFGLKDDSKYKVIWEAIAASYQEYQEYPIVEFEDIEDKLTISKSSIFKGEKEYTCKLPEYNIYVWAGSVNELKKKIAQSLQYEQDEMRIKKCLGLGD